MDIKMNVEEINSIIDKIIMYKEEESITFNDINDTLSNINYNYNTNNTNKLDMLSSELINNLNTILKIHNDNITVLEKNRDKFVETEREVIKNFEELKDNISSSNN